MTGSGKRCGGVFAVNASAFRIALQSFLQAFAVLLEALGLGAVAPGFWSHFSIFLSFGLVFAVPASALRGADLAAAIALAVVDRAVGLEAVAGDGFGRQIFFQNIVDPSFGYMGREVPKRSILTRSNLYLLEGLKLFYIY